MSLHLAVSSRLSASVASVTSSNTDKADTPAPVAEGGTFPPVLNVAALRRSFPALWAEYLRDRYKTAYAVQKAFPGIDSHTARDWLAGKRDPSGSFVAAVINRDDRALEILGRQE